MEEVMQRLKKNDLFNYRMVTAVVFLATLFYMGRKILITIGL